MSNANITVIAIITLLFLISLASFLLHIVRDRKTTRKNEEDRRIIVEFQAEKSRKEKELQDIRDSLDELRFILHEQEQSEKSLKHYKAMVKAKRNELHVLMERDIDSQCACFRETRIYHKIMALSAQKEKGGKVLAYTEQGELYGEINKCFARFIKDLSDTFPILTDDDVIICCLSVLGFSSLSMSSLFAVSGSNTIKQRKHRVKQKMDRYPESSFLRNIVFPSHNLRLHSGAGVTPYSTTHPAPQ